MAIIGEMEALITGDASGLINAINQGQSAISGFASIATGVFAGVGLLSVFQGVTSGIENMVSSVVSTGEEFQGWGAVINAVGDDTNTLFDDMGSSASGAGKKIAASILEAQDALIRYDEKIKEINDNIAETTAGDNIVKAKQQLTDKLASLDQAYADKVKAINKQILQANDSLAQNELDRAKSLQDKLLNMQEDHDLSMTDKKTSQDQNVSDTLEKNQEDFDSKIADKKAKHEQDMRNAMTGIQRKALQKQYDDEVALETTAFNNQQALKKSQMEKANAENLANDERVYQEKLALTKVQEQRRIDEQNAADEKANAAKIANLNEELAKENTAHETQAAKLKSDADQQIKELEEQNAKKLAKYKQELADEERAYQLSLEKRAAADAGGGGGGGGASGRLKLDSYSLQAGDSLAKASNSAEGLLGYLDEISGTTPFKLEDLEQASQYLLLQNVDAKQLMPTIENLGGFFQKNIGEVASAAVMALHGKTGQLKSMFNITTADMETALGRPLKSSNDVLQSLIAITNQKFSKGIEIEASKGSTATIQLENQLTKAKLAFMGISEATGKPISGGLFESLQSGMTGLMKFLLEHKDEIINILKEVAKFLVGVGTAIVNVAKWFKENQDLILAVLFGIGMAITAACIPALVALGGMIMTVAIPAIVAMLVTAAPFVIFGAVVAAVIFAILYAIRHWDEIVTIAKEVFENVKKTVTEVVQNILKWLGDKLHEFFDWGKNIGEAFVNGLKEAFSKVKDTIVSALDSAKKFIMGKSPPEEGPFSQIDEWGFNVGNAWVTGFEGALSNIQIPDISPKQQQLGSSGGGKTYNFSNQTTNTPTINQTNNFNVGGEANADNLAERLGFQIEHYGVV